MRRSKRKLLIAVSLVIITLLVLSGIYLIIHNNKVEVKLIGTDEINYTIYEAYDDKGIVVIKGDKTLDTTQYFLEIENDVDIQSLGDYLVKYKIKYRNRNYELTRLVHVVDDIAPVIETNVEKINRDYCSKKSSTELKYNAIDNYDGDITDLVDRNETEAKIVLIVHDSSGNTSKKELLVTYTDKPKEGLKLNGKSSIKVAHGSVYKELGASYQDGCGNVLDNNILITGNVDTNIDGDYIMTYKYEKTGEALERKVSVYTPTPTGNKIVYLTFDDGPCAYTQRVLDILDKYGVKATFFVTHQFPSYEYLIKSMHEKGHTIAVHTYTHNYNVYTSWDSYLYDFNLMNDVIAKYTGEKSKIFRFPGGSSNTISRNYASGIVTQIASQMSELGNVYFDWNVSSGDSGGATKEQVYNNIVNGVKKCNNCVVLMHDIKLATVNALDDVVNTLVNSGYTLAPLTIDSPTVHQRINN